MKRVFISYSADSEEHRARVLALAQKLRREGVDATLDAFAPTSAEGWSAQAIEAADFVLVICTERYRRAFDSRLALDTGASEEEQIVAFAARRPGAVVPVLLEDGASQFVPPALRAVKAMYLPEELPQLLRQLGATGTPAPPLAPPGTAPAPAGAAGKRRISNVSLREGADFVGRTFELSAIGTALSAPQQGGGYVPVILLGAAGVGKTALALQHACSRQDAYDVIWLVRAQSESTIRLDLALLSRELGLIAPGILDEEAEVLAARSWLAAHDRWLVIFDEAAGPDVVASYVPRAPRGHVIVTSRGSEWRDAGKKIALRSLAREEAIDLLLRASGRTDATGADELAAWLEGHPLMAKLAGVLARERGVGFDVLRQQLAAGAGPKASQRLDAILAAAVADARQRSPAIRELVDLIAYLAPHEIPIRLLREHVEHLAPELGAVARDDKVHVRLLDELVRLGLVARDDSALSVHGAVQAAARATAQGGAAVVLLEAAFAWDEEEPETWASAEELLPHVLVAIEDPHGPVAQPRALERLLSRTAACTRKRGEPRRAIELQRRAIALMEGRLGTGAGEADPRIALATALGTLGGMLREVGELTEAEAQLERARKLLAAFEGTAEAVPVLRELARVASARGDFALARGWLVRALGLDRERLGIDDDLSIAATLSELSGVEAEAGELDDAAQMLDHALAMQRLLLATDENPAVAATLRRSAAILERRGDLVGARERLERALEVLRCVYKTDHHVAIAEVMTDLANVLMRIGDLLGAQRLLEQALESHARLFGGGANPSSAAVTYRLARVLIHRGDLAGARRQLERTLAGMEAHGLTQHATVAAILEMLGELDAANDPATARARLEQALVIRLELSDSSSLDVLQSTARLALITAKLGQTDKAANLLEPILVYVLTDPARHLRAGAPEMLFQIADVLRQLGRVAAARDLLVAVIAALQCDSLGDELTLAHGKFALAHVHLQLEEMVEARQMAREAHDTFAAVLGRDTFTTGSAALLRAQIALSGNEPASAFGLAIRAIRAFRAFGGDDVGSREAAANALAVAAGAALGLGRRRTAAALLQRSLDRRDTPDVRTALFAVIEELAATGTTYDAAPAVTLLAKLAPSWLADRVFATAALESAQITDQLEVSLAVAGACAGAVLAPADGLPAGYGWRLELAPINAEGTASELRTLPARARYAGRGRLTLLANTSDLPWGAYMLTVRFVDGARDAWRANVTVSNVELGNPFIAGPPAKGERFFGRARLLEEMRRQLEEASIALLGPRRAGKTSVLYRLTQLCAESWTTLVVDLHGYSGLDDREVLRDLAGQIACAAGIDAPGEDRPLLALRRALEAAGARRILLMLDEMAILGRYPDVALQLRAMSKWHAPVVRIVLAGTVRDLERLSTGTRGSSPVNELLNRELDQLTHQEAVSLLEQPVLGRYRYEPAALARLLELGAGRPFFLNALAHLTLEEVRQEGTRAIAAAHVEAARQEAPIHLARWYRELQAELDDGTRAALPGLIEAGGAIPSRHAEALRSAGITVGPRRNLTLDPIFVDWWHRGGSR